jgi:hypothetical protein
MNNNEAKFVLSAYRPNGRDADDAVFSAALAQARNDPALGEWFARDRAHGATVAGKLRDIVPPAGLREAILAGARATRTPRSRWRAPTAWFALAAAVAVLLTATVTLWPGRAAAKAARFTAFAIDDTAHGQHGGHGAATSALVATLSQPTTHLAAGLPVDFATLHATGCRTLRFAGHDILEACFSRDGVWFHCYIMNLSDFPSLPRNASPEFTQENRLASADWSDATYHYVVVSEAGLAAIQRLL